MAHAMTMFATSTGSWRGASSWQQAVATARRRNPSRGSRGTRACPAAGRWPPAERLTGRIGTPPKRRTPQAICEPTVNVRRLSGHETFTDLRCGLRRTVPFALCERVLNGPSARPDSAKHCRASSAPTNLARTPPKQRPRSDWIASCPPAVSWPRSASSSCR